MNQGSNRGGSDLGLCHLTKFKIFPRYLVLSPKKCRYIQCLRNFYPIFSKNLQSFLKRSFGRRKLCHLLAPSAPKMCHLSILVTPPPNSSPGIHWYIYRKIFSVFAQHRAWHSVISVIAQVKSPLAQGRLLNVNLKMPYFLEKLQTLKKP